MDITYRAKRSREGEFYCYDIVADGVYFHLFLPNGSPLSVIEQAAEDYLDDPFPDQGVNDTITVESGTLDALEPETGPYTVYLEDYPGVTLRLIDLGGDSWYLEGVKDLL